MVNMTQIQDTWFYETNLASNKEYQNILDTLGVTELALASWFLSGPVGIGKTTQALLVARSYIVATQLEQNYWHYSFEPVFVSFKQYLEFLNDRRFGNEDLKTRAYYKLKEIEEAPFLILDDFRCVFSSEFEKTTVDNSLLDLFSTRYANRYNQYTIITSNNTKEEIKAAMSEAVCSRIFAMCEYLEINGEDKRTTA